MVSALREAFMFQRRFGWFEFHERIAPAASLMAMHAN